MECEIKAKEMKVIFDGDARPLIIVSEMGDEFVPPFRGSTKYIQGEIVYSCKEFFMTVWG